MFALESINTFVPVVTVPVPVGTEARMFNNAAGLVEPIPTFPLETKPANVGLLPVPTA